ncbi:unnamed protein product [Wickerhamomyces anomalus]
MMKNFQNFMTLNNIEAIKFENQSINTEINENNPDWMVFSKEIITKIFEVLLNKKNCNLLIIDKTNVIIGLLRKICKWNYSSLISEYRLYSGKNSNYFAETFLELATLKLKSNFSFGPASMIRSRSSRNSSLDYTYGSLNERRLSEDLELDDDENEETLLSASPQVPKNLLRMAELRKKRKKSDAKQSLESSFLSFTDYNFYLPLQIFKNIEVIEVVLPIENDLPDWFKLQRDIWEDEYHHKY